ncbi:MAG: glycosyltransferase family 39 protein [Candidatus Levybacteria bacterium]|nr:glycosyltransferase family 39 protein [Candidatus Levybacteria bacterium]
MLKKLNRGNLLLLIIFVFALVLRVYNLATVPVGFHGDEASIGYNAYSILKTGKDQNNNFLPLAIDQFGDFRPAGYHYFAVPFVAIFGLNEFSTRLPAAIVGSLSVVAIFLLTQTIFKKPSLAYIASGFLAINPWHINISRATSESVIALFFIIIGVILLIRSLQKAKRKYYIFAFACFAISFLFYHAARFFLPLFLLASSFPLSKQYLSRDAKRSLALGNAALILFLGILIFLSSGTERPLRISIVNAPENQVILSQQLTQDAGQRGFITRLYHNKPILYGRLFGINYLEHFSGDFLLFEGGFPKRYSIPWTGNFYPFEILFFVIGGSFLLYALIRDKQYLFAIPLLWVIIGPIPAALTFEDIPNVQRSSMMIPGMILLMSYGLYTLLLWIHGVWQKIAIAGVALLTLFQFLLFSHIYFHHAGKQETIYRNAGEKALVDFLSQFDSQKIISTSQNDNNVIFYLFFRKIDPGYFQSIGSPRDKDQLQFRNMLFTYAHCPLETGEHSEVAEGIPGVIYVNRGECKTGKNVEELTVIKRPDDTVAFKVVRLSGSL